MITVFTPTYNRAYILPKLYESLLAQTSYNFEWLVIDDGSIDNTEHVVNSFIAEDKITIRYIRQQNGGKHRAINRGLKEAMGELFFIVDSDDYLLPIAIERYEKHFNNIKNTPTIIGISGRRIYNDGSIIGDPIDFDIMDISTLDLRMKRNIQGDMAEAYKTEVIRKFPFPDLSDESFCPEALVWNRMAQHGVVRFFNEGYYVCEYLEDGLTNSITKIRMRSPSYACLYYGELYAMPIPALQKIKAAVNYWRFWFCDSRKIVNVFKISQLFKPFGLIMHRRDKRMTNNEI